MGAKALAVDKAIVSRLESIEELAGISILFSDKTGTLTQNKLTLGEALVWGGAKADHVILPASLSSKKEDNDPIDLAVLGALKDPSVLGAYRQVASVPFDPMTKRTEATIEDKSGKSCRVSKGMPPVIFQLAGLAGPDLKAAQKIVAENAANGYRTLAVARLDGGDRWYMLGILPMFGPPRADSKETIARAAQYGVRVKMVTGDRPDNRHRSPPREQDRRRLRHLHERGQSGAARRGAPGRRRRGLRARVPGAQMGDRQGRPATWPHRRHDRGRRQRLARPEAGRRRRRGLRSDRSGARRGEPHPDRAWALRHHSRYRGGAQDLRADDGLRLLPGCYDGQHYGLHRAGHVALFRRHPDAGDDHPSRPARRCARHADCLRQCDDWS
jgi:hypothetical protein